MLTLGVAPLNQRGLPAGNPPLRPYVRGPVPSDPPLAATPRCKTLDRFGESKPAIDINDVLQFLSRNRTGENAAHVRDGAFCQPSRKKALRRAYLLSARVPAERRVVASPSRPFLARLPLPRADGHLPARHTRRSARSSRAVTSVQAPTVAARHAALASRPPLPHEPNSHRPRRQVGDRDEQRVVPETSAARCFLGLDLALYALDGVEQLVALGDRRLGVKTLLGGADVP
jgi:hypothetical protein